MFRVMREDKDGLPNVAPSATGLGVRTGVDIDLDPHGNVVVNGKGMSVNPGWRNAPLFRIPERLRHPNKVPEARILIHVFGMGRVCSKEEISLLGRLWNPTLRCTEP